MGPNYVLDKGFIADTAITQFYAVKLSADDHVTIAAATTDQVIGICQEAVTAADATAGRVVDIRLLGISRCVCSADTCRWCFKIPTLHSTPD